MQCIGIAGSLAIFTWVVNAWKEIEQKEFWLVVGIRLACARSIIVFLSLLLRCIEMFNSFL